MQLDQAAPHHRRLLLLKAERLRRRRRQTERESLICYIKRIWPWFVIEEIHILIAAYLEALAAGDLDRLMIFMPPRSGKSLMASVAFPSFYLGHYPARKIMQASYAAELAVGFGRQVRGIVAEDVYQETFPGIGLTPDNKAAGRWATSQGGEYFAIGVKGGQAGRGFNLGVVDDPLSEQDADSEAAKRFVREAWWGPGFYTRRQPEASAILMMTTRWSAADLPGYLLELGKNDRTADQWTVLSIPALLDDEAAEKLNKVRGSKLLSPSKTGKPMPFRSGDSFAPRRWPLKELKRQKANIAQRSWEALYQQNPVQEEGAILKRHWWQRWPADLPGVTCIEVIQVYDTAFEEGEENDYSARTTWGVFKHQDHEKLERGCCILLDAWRGRVDFSDLRKEAMRAYKDGMRAANNGGYGGVDRVLVEKRASGHSLIQELRRADVPVSAVVFAKGKSKLARAYAAQVVLEQGCVFYGSDSVAREVIDECADFPFGKHDDWADTCIDAWLYLRNRYHLKLKDEPNDEDEEDEPRRSSPFG